MIKKLFPVLTLSVVISQTSQAIGLNAGLCDRNPRNEVYRGDPIPVFVSVGQRTEIEIEDPYWEGAHRHNPNGLNILKTVKENKLPLHITEPNYSGLLSIEGSSGTTYFVDLQYKEGCADTLVSLSPKPPEAEPNQTSRTYNNKPIKPLMWYLFNGKVPEGYRLVTYDGLEDNERIIFKQGSVNFQLEQQYVGDKYTGTVFSVINTGRLAFRVNLENMQAGPELTKVWGRFRQIGMLPISRRLSPAPEFISETFSDSHRGLVFLVTEKVQ